MPVQLCDARKRPVSGNVQHSPGKLLGLDLGKFACGSMMPSAARLRGPVSSGERWGNAAERAEQNYSNGSVHRAPATLRGDVENTARTRSHAQPVGAPAIKAIPQVGGGAAISLLVDR